MGKVLIRSQNKQILGIEEDYPQDYPQNLCVKESGPEIRGNRK